MKIYRTLLVALLVVLAAFVFVVPAFAQTPGPATPPTVPPELQAALLGFVAFIITQGIKSLSTFLSQYKWLSWIDISGWGSVITGFIVTGLVFYINMGLSLVPEPYLPVLPLIFQFIIGLLAAYGAHLTMKTLAGVVPAKKK